MAAYLRVSTDHQSLDQQHDALAVAGIEPDRVFSDKLSGVRDPSVRAWPMHWHGCATETAWWLLP